MDKTGTVPTLQRVKYNPQFKEDVDKYIDESQKSKQIPTIAGFAKKIGVDESSVWAWAEKKVKNEKGELTSQLARPQFFAQIKKLEKLSQQEPEEEKKKKLNEKQELFCQLYASDRDFFGNGVLTYAEAYDLDIAIPKNYNTAKTNAWRLLTNADILKRIDEILELGPLNDTYVDRQLAKVIAQDADFGAKVSAIREYNKLKTRITEKIDHTTKGEKLPAPAPIYGGKSVESVE